MIKFIDDFLNKITMYRLVMYYLIALLLAALGLSAFGLIHYSFLDIFFSSLFLVAIGWGINKILAKIFKVPTNVESAIISALILALILAPTHTLSGYLFLFWAAVLAMASKYLVNVRNKHIFNPVALSVAFIAFFTNQSANWWVGTLYMLPVVLIGGALVVRKIRRWDLVYSFLIASLVTSFVFSTMKGADLLTVAKQAVFDSPLWFFAFVMITEPLTTPPTKKLQVLYGILTGFLFAPQTRLAGISFTPELALLAGNVFSYVASPKQRLMLYLKEKIQLSPTTYDFVFSSEAKVKFKPGQYMEWTIGETRSDNRGNRRYFTLASSPTEDDVRLGVKFYDRPSSFKKALQDMSPGEPIIGAQLAGEFTLPRDPKQACVFIAGGIGVTPFRSMIKYLLDKQEKRPITLLYAVKNSQEAVYKDIFDLANKALGIKTYYIISDVKELPSGWPGRTGMLDRKAIEETIPDFRDNIFYISGPHAMVNAFERVLTEMGVAKNKIKIDFFPGFA